MEAVRDQRAEGSGRLRLPLRTVSTNQREINDPGLLAAFLHGSPLKSTFMRLLVVVIHSKPASHANEMIVQRAANVIH